MRFSARFRSAISFILVFLHGLHEHPVGHSVERVLRLTDLADLDGELALLLPPDLLEELQEAAREVPPETTMGMASGRLISWDLAAK